MSGIVGYIGFRPAKEMILNGLKRMEYRGYDATGIAIQHHEAIHIYTERGNVAQLEQRLEGIKLAGTVGMGHTCWAAPSGHSKQENIFLQQNASGRYVLLQSGQIGNEGRLAQQYLVKRDEEEVKGTQLTVHLIEYFSRQGLTTEEAFRQVLHLLEGSFSLILMDKEDPSRLYAAKNRSPLVAGLGDGEMMVASDITALIHLTSRFVQLKDGEYVLLERDSLAIKNLAGEKVERDSYTVTWDESVLETGEYEHYMLKEIDEQPVVIRELISQYFDERGRIRLAEALSDLAVPQRIFIVACGTSYHAGLVGRRFLEQMAHIPTEVHVASEFMYDQILIEGEPLFIFISQSGETADTLGVLDKMKKEGYPTLAVTNVPGSTLYREADVALLTHAGPEIAVASTKAYTAQITVMALLASCLAGKKGRKSPLVLEAELSRIATAMGTLLDQKEKAKEIARTLLAGQEHCFFMGRLQDYAVSLEAALKLKETSYIQAEGYASGEMRHGPIALIEEGTPLFVLITDERIANITRKNTKEMEARGAATCIIATENVAAEGDDWILPQVHPLLTPLISVIPFQLIAYYTALARGCDVDKPRNLSKAVTTE